MRKLLINFVVACFFLSVVAPFANTPSFAQTGTFKAQQKKLKKKKASKVSKAKASKAKSSKSSKTAKAAPKQKKMAQTKKSPSRKIASQPDFMKPMTRDVALQKRLKVSKKYYAKPGDRLYTIASRLYGYSTWWRKLQAENPKFRKFKADQTVPTGTAVSYKAPKVGNPYVVQRGDQLPRVLEWKYGAKAPTQIMGSIRAGDKIKFEKDGTVQFFKSGRILAKHQARGVPQTVARVQTQPKFKTKSSVASIPIPPPPVTTVQPSMPSTPSMPSMPSIQAMQAPQMAPTPDNARLPANNLTQEASPFSAMRIVVGIILLVGAALFLKRWKENRAIAAVHTDSPAPPTENGSPFSYEVTDSKIDLGIATKIKLFFKRIFKKSE